MSIVDDGAVIEAVRTTLQNDPRVASLLGNRSREICAGREINEDPNRCPWVGVYPVKSVVSPATLPRGNRATVTVEVCAQVASLEQDRTMQGLRDLRNAVTAAILAKPPGLAEVVDMVQQVETGYTILIDSQKKQHLQMAIIRLVLLASGTDN